MRNDEIYNIFINGNIIFYLFFSTGCTERKIEEIKLTATIEETPTSVSSKVSDGNLISTPTYTPTFTYQGGNTFTPTPTYTFTHTEIIITFTPTFTFTPTYTPTPW